jgi:hypothetical protein
MVALGHAFLTMRFSRRSSLKTAISGVSDPIVPQNLEMPQKRLAQKTLEHWPAQNTRHAPASQWGGWVVMAGLTA